MRAFALWLFLISPAAAQITADVAIRQAIAGIGDARTAGGFVLLPEGAQPRIGPAAHITYHGADGWALAVKASDLKREPVAVAELAAGEYLVIGSGRVIVEAFAVNWTDQQMQLIETAVDIGVPEPEPDPEPDPGPDPDPVPDDIPPDPFDNIGQRVAAWATGLPGRDDFAGVFEWAAAQLRSDPRVTVNDVQADLSAAFSGSPHAAEWQAFRAKLNEDIGKRYADGTLRVRGVLAEYYAAVAVGLKGGNDG